MCICGHLSHPIKKSISPREERYRIVLGTDQLLKTNKARKIADNSKGYRLWAILNQVKGAGLDGPYVSIMLAVR